MTNQVSITALRSYDGKEGRVRRGSTLVVDRWRADELVRAGVAMILLSQKEAPAHENKMAPVHPSKASQSGGVTGEAKPSPSSQEAPRQAKRTSSKPKGKRGS